MEPALRDLKHTSLHSVDQSMLPVDAPGPKTAKILFQWLRFTQSGKRLTLYIVDQHVDLVAHT
jgi:hypothetical protein